MHCVTHNTKQSKTCMSKAQVRVTYVQNQIISTSYCVLQIAERRAALTDRSRETPVGFLKLYATSLNYGAAPRGAVRWYTLPKGTRRNSKQHCRRIVRTASQKRNDGKPSATATNPSKVLQRVFRGVVMTDRSGQRTLPFRYTISNCNMETLAV